MRRNGLDCTLLPGSVPLYDVTEGMRVSWSRLTDEGEIVREEGTVQLRKGNEVNAVMGDGTIRFLFDPTPLAPESFGPLHACIGNVFFGEDQ